MNGVDGNISCNMLSTQGETSCFEPFGNSGFEPFGDFEFEPSGDPCFEPAGDSWVDTTVDSGDLLEDFSGCTWSSTLLEFPPWIKNLE